MTRQRLWIFCTFFILFFSLGGLGLAQRYLKAGSHQHQRPETSKFNRLSEAEWKEVFFDSGQQDWRINWFLDGDHATIKHSDRGMDFFAGPEARNNAHHAVLWTQQSFEGDIKIEYEYTRLDEATQFVNILYIQATGSGTLPYVEDIANWKNLRAIPAMDLYFDHMNVYHLSYAAFGIGDRNTDYIRARRYLPLEKKGLNGTEIQNEYSNTGLFETGAIHSITVIKHGPDLYMQISNHQKTMLYHWVNETLPPIQHGRIGLRHMYTRGARYRNFRISKLGV